MISNKNFVPLSIKIRNFLISIWFFIPGPSRELWWKKTGASEAADKAFNLQEELRKLGVPITAEEFENLYSVPTELNCGKELMQALLEYGNAQKSYSSRTVNSEATLRRSIYRAKDHELAKAKDLCNSMEAAASDLLEQMKKPRLRPTFNYKNPGSLEFWELLAARSAVLQWCLKAKLLAKDGKAEDSIANLDHAMKLSSLVGDVPFLICHLAEIGNFTNIFKAVLDCIQLDPQNARKYSDIFDVIPIRSIRQTIVGETYYGMASLRQVDTRETLKLIILGSLDDPLEMDFIDSSGLPNGRMGKAIFTSLFTPYKQFLEVLDQSSEKQRDQLILIAQSVRRSPKKDFTTSKFCAIFSFDTQVFFARERLCISLQLLKCLSIVVQEFHETGQFPQELPQDIPSFGRDTAMKPFIFQISRKNVTIISECLFEYEYSPYNRIKVEYKINQGNNLN